MQLEYGGLGDENAKTTAEPTKIISGSKLQV